MLSFFKDKNIVKSNKVIGVHCIMLADGEMEFYYVIICKVKGKINIEKHATLKGNLEQLFGEIPSDVPVYLSLDGKGVLSKKITLEAGRSPIHQFIPNASEDEFLLHQTIGTDKFAFVSLARKDLVDNVLKDFVQRKLHVIGLSLGPFSSVKIINIFNHLPADIWICNYFISFDREQGSIIDFRKESENDHPEEYTIDDEILKSNYLIPLYQALSYYVPDMEELKYPPVQLEFTEYASKRIFTLAGGGILAFLFFILLVNMMMFSGYSKEKQQLETQVESNLELLNSLKTLKAELSWKEVFLSEAGILKNTRMSYYADQLAFSLPITISLEKMEIHPIISKIQKSKEIELQPNVIIIEGKANSSENINGWINNLKQLMWIKSVSVVNYTRDEHGIGNFSLNIEINRLNKINSKK